MVKSWFKEPSDYLFGFGILFLLSGLFLNSFLHGGDFQVFYLAGQRFLENISLYQDADGWSPFKYHPAWAAFFTVLTLLPFKASLLLFTAINLSFWGRAFYQWARMLKLSVTTAGFFWFLLLGLNAISSETAYGQLNGFLFWGATQIFLWLESENPRPILAGVLLAVLISLKLHFGILLVYVLYKNQRTALGLILGGLSLHLVIAVSRLNFINWELYQSWLHILLTQSENQFNTFEVQGVLRLCYAIFGPSYAKLAWAATLVIFAALGVYLQRRRFERNQNFVSPAALVGCYWFAILFFFSPLAWWYQVLYLFPLSFLMLKVQPTKLWRAVAWASLFVFAVMSFNTLGREGIITFKLYMGYFIAGLAVFVGFLTTLESRERLSKEPQSIVAG